LTVTNDPAISACLPAYEPSLVIQSQLPMGACFLVIDETVLGRSWGGFRVAENLPLDEVRVLARTMTMKTMLAGIPIGGAKGGVSLSTSQYSREEMLQFTSMVVGPYVKQHQYFLGTDIGFTESDVDSLYHSVHTKRKVFSQGLNVGDACATGISASLEYLQRNGICRYDQKTVALEGFGRIGIPTAKLLEEEGYRIVAISNLAGTLHDSSGLSVPQLLSIPATSPRDILSTYSKNHMSATILPRQALTQIAAEILIPGARALVIDPEAARQMKAKVICPISNAPVTADAEEILAKAGTVSMPDIITNSGGLIASFAQHLGADVTQTKKIIVEIIARNLDSVYDDEIGREVPKKSATAVALARLDEIRKSEKIGTLKFLLPWIRALGLNAVLNGFKEYLGLKVGG